MMDVDLDLEEKIVSVISILEGGVSADSARQALVVSGGSVEGALQAILDRPQSKTSAASRVPVPVIDLDGCGSERKRPRLTPRPALAASGAHYGGSSGSRALAAELFRGSSLAERGGLSGASSASKPSRLGSVKISGELLRAQSEWTLLDAQESTSCSRSSSSGVGDLSWAGEVLKRDPPCLTLQRGGLQVEVLPQVSDGLLHFADGDIINTISVHRDNARPALGPDGLPMRRARSLTGFYTYEGGQLQLRKKLLVMLFKQLLAKVRYPPASVECCWKVVEADSRRIFPPLPADLRGHLPSRPFRLLDNSTDLEAPQPPHFQDHPLRPEQLRSLSWMLSREGVAGAAAGEAAVEGSENQQEPFLVEWRSFWIPDFSPEHSTEQQIIEGAWVKLRAGCLPSAVVDVETNREAEWLPIGFGEVESCISGEAVVRFVQSQSEPGGSRRQVRLLELRGGHRKLGIGLLKCQCEDLEFVNEDLPEYLRDIPGGLGHDNRGLRNGSLVRIRPDIRNPTYGWGGVSPGETGVLQKRQGEVCIVKFAKHPQWKGVVSELDRVHQHDGERRFMVEARVRVLYPVGGGILADKIGYGKTATTIALIDATIARPLPPIPDVDRASFIPARGTLIIVPSNLFDQWLQEIAKFVWQGRPLRKNMSKGWSPQGCPLKIFAMSNVSPLTSVRAEELAQADVVLCSYRLLFSPIYQARLKELSGDVGKLWALAQATKELLSGKSRFKSGRKGDKVATRWQDVQFPMLEMFYWHRVVFDEFHELESFESAQQNSLQHLRSHYRWGLTGTPPVGTAAGVIFMSSLFRVDLPGYLSMKNHESMPDLTPWEADRLLVETAGRFLDHFARQNTAELPHIGLEEHVVAVHHTPAERALYLSQAHDAPDMASEDAFATEDNIRALERLLKLCSHFQATGDNNAVNATEECHRHGEQKERRLTRVRNQLARCARVLHLLSRLLQAAPASLKDGWRDRLDSAEKKLAGEGDNGAAALRELQEATTEASRESWVEALNLLELHKPRDTKLLEALGPLDSRRGYAEEWANLAERDLDSKHLAELLRGQAKEQAENAEELHEARTSHEFFRKTLAALAQDDSPENRSCTVCLEDGLPLKKLAITPCAHTFCMDCLRKTVEKFRRCSICNGPLMPKDVRALSAELNPVPVPMPLVGTLGTSGASSSSSSPGSAAAAACKTAPDTNDKYGTKLATLVAKLREVRVEDPTAKVILFVQFDDLKRKVATVLLDCGIPAVQLHGSVCQRSNIINDWQNNPSSDNFVLLLSLAQSASGANLTAANHVVFLHPMLAATPELAIGHELQAIGRVRRHGQPRDTVHVWRFVTADTVEQSITERHQAGLWERERLAREARPPTRAAPEPAGGTTPARQAAATAGGRPRRRWSAGSTAPDEAAGAARSPGRPPPGSQLI